MGHISHFVDLHFCFHPDRTNLHLLLRTSPAGLVSTSVISTYILCAHFEFPLLSEDDYSAHTLILRVLLPCTKPEDTHETTVAREDLIVLQHFSVHEQQPQGLHFISFSRKEGAYSGGKIKPCVLMSFIFLHLGALPNNSPCFASFSEYVLYPH